MLDDLVSVIETLRERIRTYGATLREGGAKEMRTRTVLIDPLLRVLGWDVSDPSSITLEYVVGNGRADYALLNERGSAVAFIEAKHLGEPLERPQHEEQVFTYALRQQVKYAALTDGDRWILDDVSVFSGDRRLLDISITNMPVHEIALRMLLLWRPNLSSGQPVVAEEPLLVEWADEQELADVSDEITETSLSPTPYPSPEPSNSPPSVEGWVQLSDWDPPPKTLLRGLIRFSDGAEKPVKNWKDLLKVAGEWLHDSGKLAAAAKPILSGNTEKVLDTNNSGFRTATQIAETGFWLNSHGNANNMRRKTRALLNHCNVSPDTVWLKVEP